MDEKNKKIVEKKEQPQKNVPQSEEKVPKPEDNEMKELLQRTQANFENYRKQTEKRIEEIKQIAAKEIIVELLSIVDNFELALKNIGCNEVPKEFKEGIELIYSQLMNILKDRNIKKIPAEGENFNPHFHEALMKVEANLPENKILEVFQDGFTLNGKVLRHAKVKISSGKKNTENKNEKIMEEK
ncbi:MAG: nucleotide exchange factor GrpE [Nanoarchaeota archaeon]|nr:nucleotide exchange factor GrpE [Nanoarchaeota archaeon]